MIFEDLSIVFKCLLIMLCIVILVYIIQPAYQENFTSNDTSTYYKIYDSIFYQPLDTQYEFAHIINTMSTESRILDIGSGTGHRVKELHKRGLRVTGLEESDLLCRDTLRRYPTCNIQIGSPSNTLIFQPESFTHILCLDSTIYKYKDKSTLVENIRHWLEPDGLFIVHVSDHKQPTKGKYQSSITGNLLVETVHERGQSARRHSKLYPESTSHILYMIQQHGFLQVANYEQVYSFKKI